MLQIVIDQCVANQVVHVLGHVLLEEEWRRDVGALNARLHPPMGVLK